MILLMGCESNPKIEYVQRDVPWIYLQECPREFNDNTIMEVVLGLDKIIRCYESKQDALREFLTEGE